MFTIATQHVLSNTTVHRPLGTLKADVLVVYSSPEASRASRCWARRSHGRSLPSTDRTSSTTLQAAPPFIEVVYGANILSFARQKTMSIVEAHSSSHLNWWVCSSLSTHTCTLSYLISLAQALRLEVPRILRALMPSDSGIFQPDSNRPNKRRMP